MDGKRKVELRLTDEQYHGIATAARAKGLSVAGWLRMTVIEALAGQHPAIQSPKSRETTDHA